MGADLALLIASVALSGLSALGVGWLALRLRSRGVKASRVTITKGSFGSLFGTVLEGHEHQFAEKNYGKYGDTKWHCTVDGCGEPAPEKKDRGM